MRPVDTLTVKICARKVDNLGAVQVQVQDWKLMGHLEYPSKEYNFTKGKEASIQGKARKELSEKNARTCILRSRPSPVVYKTN